MRGGTASARGDPSSLPGGTASTPGGTASTPGGAASISGEAASIQEAPPGHEEKPPGFQADPPQTQARPPGIEEDPPGFQENSPRLRRIRLDSRRSRLDSRRSRLKPGNFHGWKGASSWCTQVFQSEQDRTLGLRRLLSWKRGGKSAVEENPAWSAPDSPRRELHSPGLDRPHLRWSPALRKRRPFHLRASFVRRS